MAAVDFASLATRFERAQAEAMVELARDASPVAGGWMTYGGAGAFVNKACGLGLVGAVEEDTARAISAFFTARGVTPQVEVCPCVHPSLLLALGRAAFQLKEFENVLFLELDRPEASRPALSSWPEGLLVERVDAKNPRAVQEYVALSSSGFVQEGAPLSEGFLASSLKAPQLPGYEAYVARLDGQPAGASGCASRRGLTTLFGTSVLPAFRRRGIQQALFAVRLERARALGSTLAAVVSHPGMDTERNAVRLGFRMAYTRAVLVQPATGAKAP
jgi:hypothetical protein